MKAVGTILAMSVLALSNFAQDAIQLRQERRFRQIQNIQVGPDQRRSPAGSTDGSAAQRAIDVELMKGLTKTEDENANLLIGYQVAINQEKGAVVQLEVQPGWLRAGWGADTRHDDDRQTSTIYVGTVRWICMTPC
jgi:hypothetical protein